MNDEAIANLRLRFPAEMRKKLGEAAEQNGRSLNAELIDRLQRSFNVDEPLAEKSFGGRHLYIVGQCVAQAAALVELARNLPKGAKKTIDDDPTTFAMAREAMLQAINLYRGPEGELDLPQQEIERRGRDIGRIAVNSPPEDIDQLVRDPASNTWGQMILKMIVAAGGRLDEAGSVHVQLGEGEEK
ncbi:MAG: Arc family DNA-binding protein [Hyphomicrobium sp.]